MIELGGNLIGMGMGGTQNFGGPGSCFMGAESCLMDPEHDCRSARTIYSIGCLNCLEEDPPINAQYLGTSGRTSHSRMVEHKAALRNNSTRSSLVKHQNLKHPGQNPRLQARNVKSGVRFNTDRFLHEALAIQDANDNPDVLLLNQKGEWGQAVIPRLRVDQ